MENETKIGAEVTGFHRYNMEIPIGMKGELQELSRQKGRNAMDLIKTFVELRSFVDKAILERHALNLSIEVTAGDKPILSPDLALLRFVGQDEARKIITFSDREFSFLRTKPNMGLYIRESVAFGLEILKESKEKHGLKFSVGDHNFLFIL